MHVVPEPGGVLIDCRADRAVDSDWTISGSIGGIKRKNLALKAGSVGAQGMSGMETTKGKAAALVEGKREIPFEYPKGLSHNNTSRYPLSQGPRRFDT